MPVQSSYGTAFSNTWTDFALAYDGDTVTSAYLSTAAGGTAVGEISGLGFGSGGAHEVPLNVNLISNGVTVQIWYDVGTVNRWSSVTVQAYDGVTSIGTPTDITASLSTDNLNNTTAILNGVTVAHLRSANFKVRITAVRVGTASNTIYVRQMTITVTYGNTTMWTGTEWRPFVIWDGTAWNSNYVVWTGSAWA